MDDGKIHIPARKRQPGKGEPVIRVSPEAYSVLVDIYNESALSIRQIASLLIIQSADRVVFDKEEDYGNASIDHWKIR